MKNAVKRIGVLTSGGDAPGMNACIRAVVRSANARGIECVGIRRGYQGLISGDIVEMDNASVSRIINRGGTILYSARCDEFRTKEGQEKAYATCKLIGLDGLVAIGGDGTFRGAQDLSKFGVSVVGIPGTIDNDIVCTDYTIGFDTAANTAVECMDKWRSWATAPVIWRCMWAWPSAPPPCWCPSAPTTLKSTWLRRSAAPVSAARPTL